jgi:hypothetical protein
MTTHISSIEFNRFYDSVLHEMELGRIDQGINLLVGFLDALHFRGSALCEARQVLAEHMLHQMLLEEPLYAYAARWPSDFAGLVSIAANTSVSRHISQTGLRLFEATRNLPLIRALRQRQLDGHQICLLHKGKDPVHAALTGRDLSNVTIIDTDADDPFHFVAGHKLKFDLICMADVADGLDGAALTALLCQTSDIFSPTGTAILSALRPDHLGTGWGAVCLNWKAQTHEASALQRAANEAGFSAQIYGDQSDCFIWAELRPAQFSRPAGNTNHAY